MPAQNAQRQPSSQGGRQPTLADVARLANVSTATVSRCLNTPDQVVADTRERVQAAIETLGYSPNFSARALAANKTFTIGAVIPTMENAIFARGLQAFQEELGQHGYTLLVASSAYRTDLEADQIRTLVARGVDALLLIGYDRDPALYDFLERRGVPFVIAWAVDDQRPQAAIGFDNTGAMFALTERVLAQGHRRLGMISAPIADNDRARNRVEGARLAMARAGHDPAALTVVETDYGIENGASAFQQLMSAHPAITAVLCGNDVLGVGALTQAKAMGLRVPDDVSVTGFDDLDLAMLTDPGLTTVHVPHRDMGRGAARQLIEMIRQPDALRRTTLAIDLRLRGSLGPAATRA